MKILYEDNHLLAVVKPPNWPVQRDSSQDMDLQTALKEYITEKYGKPGNVYLGIVHRLDRPVGGVMVFARTSKAAARLSAQFATDEPKKRYYAVVRGEPGGAETLEDYLIKGPGNTSRVAERGEPGARLARLSYTALKRAEGLTLLEVLLYTGRAHQIRVQLSSRGWPIWGDARYGFQQHEPGQQIALWAYSLTVMHPTTKELLTFTEPPPRGYPWSLFFTQK